MKTIFKVVVIFTLGALFSCSDSFSPKANSKSSSSVKNAEIDKSNVGNVDETTSTNNETGSASTESSDGEDHTTVTEQADAPAVVSGAFLTKTLSNGFTLVCNIKLDIENVDQTADVVGCNVLNTAKEKFIDFELGDILFVDKMNNTIKAIGNDVSPQITDEWTIMIKLDEGKAASIVNVKINFEF